MDNGKNVFKIKRNDTLPYLKLQVLTVGSMNETLGYTLSAATAMTFTMVSECGENKVYAQSAETLCRNEGLIQYKWQIGDTDTSGSYKGEFKIYFTGDCAGILSIPSYGHIPIEIFDDVDVF